MRWALLIAGVPQSQTLKIQQPLPTRTSRKIIGTRTRALMDAKNRRIPRKFPSDGVNRDAKDRVVAAVDGNEVRQGAAYMLSTTRPAIFPARISSRIVLISPSGRVDTW